MSRVASEARKPLPEGLYEWFNSLVGRPEPITASELGEMWTEDCAMITDGQVKCAGLPAFAKHFNEIRHKLKSWKVNLPLAMKVVQGNLTAVYYSIEVVMADGAEGKVLVCAFFEFRDGKAVRMTEIAHREGVHLELENH